MAPGLAGSGLVTRAETLVWGALAVIVLLGHLAITHGPLLGNDAYQYLSVTNNFLAGTPASTSIVHFDPERSWGRIPAPLTTFPPGYPLAVAAVALTGLSTESAALLVSAASFVLLIPLLIQGARSLALGSGVTRALLVALIGNSWAAIYATAATTESLFTLASFAAVVFLIAAMSCALSESTTPQPSAAGTSLPVTLLLLGSLLAGLAYWVRYAGLFLLAALGLYYLVRLAMQRDRRALIAFGCLGVAVAVVGAGLVRNQLLAGSWKGGNTKIVHHPLGQVLRETTIWLHHLFLGGIADAHVGIAEALLAVGVVGLVAAAVGGTKRAPHRPGWPGSGTSLLLCYAFVYCAGMVYLGVTSVISFDTRMFYPLLPVLLLLLGVVLTAGAKAAASRGRSWIFTCGLLLAGAGYLWINARSYLAPPAPAPHQSIERQLAGEVAPGVTLRAWLQRSLPPAATVVANRGQAAAYVIHRNTVSLITREYSDQQWDERTMRALMRRFHARYLILFTGDAPSLVTLSESPFLAGLVRGAPCSWLTPAARNHDAVVFQAAP
jgi:hypothetical protein